MTVNDFMSEISAPDDVQTRKLTMEDISLIKRDGIFSPFILLSFPSLTIMNMIQTFVCSQC